MRAVAAACARPPISSSHAQDDFEFLFRRFFPRLASISRRITGDAAAGEDIAQETLLRALRNMDRLNAAAAWPWLRTVATNLAIDHTRKRRREILGSTDPEGAVIDISIADGDPAGLLDAVAHLPPRQRVAMGLRYVEGWDHAEVASYMGIGGAALTQILFRARQKLRDEYVRLSEGVAAIAGLPLVLWRRLARPRRARAALLWTRNPAATQLAPVIAAMVTVLGVGSPAVAHHVAASHSGVTVRGAAPDPRVATVGVPARIDLDTNAGVAGASRTAVASPHAPSGATSSVPTCGSPLRLARPLAGGSPEVFCSPVTAVAPDGSLLTAVANAATMALPYGQLKKLLAAPKEASPARRSPPCAATDRNLEKSMKIGDPTALVDPRGLALGHCKAPHGRPS